ncbi:glycosyltransferase family 76 protein [Schizophyllum commune H4-8]|uniref:glycosyltransferase family 76 protein n=1 Tax=Schizophyllum commune (strain H4-8 / FGSC 9210) TaxID=578458 RepID=UPI00215FF907|nr:glycosyltransferase family 76 protein [Schizophyllum commune H4-8]KAI5889799.1 glycosyltransferase family 76 protein [Schizophyllum commune H4-8]
MDQKIEQQRYRDDRARLRTLSYASRALLILFALLASYLLPPFDASAKADSFTAPWSDALVRWDVFHFAQIARGGYQYEHQWAFFPGLPWLLRATAFKERDYLLGGALLVLLCDTTLVMYDLSLLALGNRDAALLSAMLSLLPSSPATLRLVPYAEPFFTYLSYRGMLFCMRTQWLYAAISFALAGSFRSNGVTLAGFLIWGMLIAPLLERRAHTVRPFVVIRCIIYVALVFAPFVYHQYTGYRAFCTAPGPPTTDLTDLPSWCTNTLPLIYSHVQTAYWNVGFLRYWTLQQLPNFVIAAPPLAAILSFAFWHLRRTVPGYVAVLRTYVSQGKSTSPGAPIPSSTTTSPAITSQLPSAAPLPPFLSPALTPHVLHATFMALVLIFASHVQIVLRFAAAMPATYWAGAWLLVRDGTDSAAEGGRGSRAGRAWSWGRAWVAWSVVWGALSVLLWVAFLPPA